MNWLWKLERKFGRYAIVHLVKYLAILNGATFLVLYVLNPQAQARMYNALALIPSQLFKGEVWRLVTFILLPETLSPLWAALSIYLFYIIGTAVERNWGAFKFNMYYLIGMLGTLVGAVIVGLVSPSFAATTATYLNLSLFLAFATLFPNYQLMIFFVLPVKVKWLGWLQAAFLLWTILSSLFTGYWAGAIAPLVSLANYLLIFGRDLYNGLHLRVRSQNNRKRFFDEINRATREREERQKHQDNVRKF
jgi:hypothetical protein